MGLAVPSSVANVFTAWSTFTGIGNMITGVSQLDVALITMP